jgi:hypothetical protein
MLPTRAIYLDPKESGEKEKGFLAFFGVSFFLVFLRRRGFLFLPLGFVSEFYVACCCI